MAADLGVSGVFVVQTLFNQRSKQMKKLQVSFFMLFIFMTSMVSAFDIFAPYSTQGKVLDANIVRNEDVPSNTQYNSAKLVLFVVGTTPPSGARLDAFCVIPDDDANFAKFAVIAKDALADQSEVIVSCDGWNKTLRGIYPLQ